MLCFAGLVAIARSPNPIPSRTRPLNSSAPMVLCLKTWESRSLPGLLSTAKQLLHTPIKTPPVRHHRRGFAMGTRLNYRSHASRPEPARRRATKCADRKATSARQHNLRKPAAARPAGPPRASQARNSQSTPVRFTTTLNRGASMHAPLPRLVAAPPQGASTRYRSAATGLPAVAGWGSHRRASTLGRPVTTRSAPHRPPSAEVTAPHRRPFPLALAPASGGGRHNKKGAPWFTRHAQSSLWESGRPFAADDR